jgi:hypothetical protein
MATRHSCKAPRDRNQRSAGHVYGVPVPERLHEAIELERENLSRVESLLACMITSMESQLEARNAYYPDVAQLARELVERSINALDPFELKRRLLDKVEEEFCMSFAGLMYPLADRSDPRHALIC